MSTYLITYIVRNEVNDCFCFVNGVGTFRGNVVADLTSRLVVDCLSQQ